MISPNKIDAARALRNAFGAFPTGVTIITTRDSQGSAVGLTVNSFTSVSLDPPLVLWSLAGDSPSRALFESTDTFAVSVLAQGQEDISKRFAAKGATRADKFKGVALDSHPSGLPLIHGAAAQFICRRQTTLPGGDHVIFLGEVTWFHRAHHAPLVFYAGHYRKLGA